MMFHKCPNCSAEFLFGRAACPNCHSTKLEKTEVNTGKVVETVHLIATPDPFPDEYSIVLFETENGARGFCRTDAQLQTGDSIVLKEDEFGPVCSHS